MTSTNPDIDSSARSLIRVLLNSVRTGEVSPPYPSPFRTTRPNASGSSMVPQQQKCSVHQVAQLLSRNLAAQTCTKLDQRVLICELGSSQNATSSAEISPSSNALCSSLPIR